MRKLRRKLRNSQDDDFSLPTWDDPSLNDSRPMDTQEQEELVREMEKSQAQQSRLWRVLFALLLFCFAVFLLYSICQQVLSPWELSDGQLLVICDFAAMLIWKMCLLMMKLSHFDLDQQRYHAYFMEEMLSWMIISADWLAVVAYSSAIIGLLHDSKHHRQWIWYSLFTGIVLAAFWLYYMLRLPRFRWDVIWLPFGPLSGAALALYVDHLLTESSEEIRKLRGYMERERERELVQA
ncbi:uncharacterized protein LOC126604441 isoform X1 [Malus sylvestris]|uniref:uncharacterized protein LOC126604441 isoform X1 n=1 Tax=Malus sylvestris TaxID=3752 RepID=UPI0021AD4D41|nr:uncharacterized protein LOC126604441 isoform X1 [Malus sylvestris]